MQGAAEMTDIAVADAPVAMPVDWAFWGWVIGALLLLVALVLLVLWWRRRRSRKVAEEPLEVRTLRLLGALGAGGLAAETATQLDHKQFCVELGLVLRGYLDGRFGLETLESTGRELMEVVMDHPVLSQWQEEFRDYVRVTDRVKFATSRLEAGPAGSAGPAGETGEAKRLLVFARKVVVETPVVVEVPVAVEKPAEPATDAERARHG